MVWYRTTTRPIRWELRFPRSATTLAVVEKDVEGWFWRSLVSDDCGPARWCNQAKVFAQESVVKTARAIIAKPMGKRRIA